MKNINQKLKIEMRAPRMSDLNSCLEMINSLVEERAMITIQKKLTLRDEREYLKKIIKDKNAIHVFLLVNGELMGNARIARLENVRSHIGELGISIKKEARGLGLGEKILKEVLKQGIKKFKLKIITLDANKSNKIAQNLYKKVGFKKIATIKGGVLHYGKYEDSVTMVKYIN
jgi:RimJ/RimL family protein N-acetyltransferase